MASSRPSRRARRRRRSRLAGRGCRRHLRAGPLGASSRDAPQRCAPETAACRVRLRPCAGRRESATMTAWCLRRSWAVVRSGAVGEMQMLAGFLPRGRTIELPIHQPGRCSSAACFRRGCECGGLRASSGVDWSRGLLCWPRELVLLGPDLVCVRRSPRFPPVAIQRKGQGHGERTARETAARGAPADPCPMPRSCRRGCWASNGGWSLGSLRSRRHRVSERALSYREAVSFNCDPARCGVNGDKGTCILIPLPIHENCGLVGTEWKCICK